MRVTALLLSGVILLLAACGQKGPLYLPDKHAPMVSSAPAAAAAPAAPAAPPKKTTDPDQDGDSAPPPQ
jgi:predicted small lipoprotein YifL